MEVETHLSRAWLAWKDLQERLELGEIVVLDGGNGTEIQKRQDATGKALLDDRGWCCASQLQAPEIVKDVHKTYFRSGAQVIITNT